MKPRGYNKPLYVLNFGKSDVLMREFGGAEKLSEIKWVIYDSFKQAVSNEVPKEKAGILVNERYDSEEILRDASANGLITAYSVGKNQNDFEYGEDFAAHIEQIQPTFCKVSVCCDPDVDTTLTQAQFAKLKRFTDYLRAQGKSRLMLELDVSQMLLIEKAMRAAQGSHKLTQSAKNQLVVTLEELEKLYKLELKYRPELTEAAIRQLQDAGIEPDVWMFRGFPLKEDCERIAAFVKRDGSKKVGCIMSSPYENTFYNERLQENLRVAANSKGVSGFVLSVNDIERLPLQEYLKGHYSRANTVEEIARSFRKLVDVFEKANAPKNTRICVDAVAPDPQQFLDLEDTRVSQTF